MPSKPLTAHRSIVRRDLVDGSSRRPITRCDGYYLRGKMALMLTTELRACGSLVLFGPPKFVAYSPLALGIAPRPRMAAGHDAVGRPVVTDQPEPVPAGFPHRSWFQVARPAAAVHQHRESARRPGVLHRQRTAAELNHARIAIHRRTLSVVMGQQLGWS